eukprot:GFUD01015138.1.p1 GENE.GFUD01015138.1~~GFUD01015138.1.p1  ORF type:complete len:217 (-),score=64.77 GFUD01015138.1:92-742(-)
MQLSFKTLDNKVIELKIAEDEPIGDIINTLKDKWGKENSYRLIYAGKVLKVGSLLSEYSVVGTLPIIVLITKPAYLKQNIEQRKSTKYTNLKAEKDEAALKKNSRQFVLSRLKKSDFEALNNNYNITDTDFSSSLSLIMDCKYMFQDDIERITKEEMMLAINTRFVDDDPEEAPVKDMIIEKLEEVVSAGPNKAQFKAFLTLGFCWCQTYLPQRDC